MSRMLEIKRLENVIGCKAVYKVYLNDKSVGTISNGQIFRCEIPENIETVFQIKEKFTLTGLGSSRITVERGSLGVSYTLDVGFSYMGGTDFTLSRRVYRPPFEISGDKVSFSNDGIHYFDSEDNEHIIHYRKAHKYWHIQNGKRRQHRRPNVCDIVRNGEDNKVIIHTDPIVEIYCNALQIEEIIKGINGNGYGYNIIP